MSAEIMRNEACVVIVTCGTKTEAETIAEKIVTERLAACVNVLGDGTSVKSFYIWEGKLQKETEIILFIKTTPDLLSRLEKRIKELHSYTVPEFIALPIVFGGQSYLRWIKENVG